MAQEGLGLCQGARETRWGGGKTTTWTEQSQRLFAAAVQCRPKSKRTVHALRSLDRRRESRDREPKWWVNSSATGANDRHRQKRRTRPFRCRRITNLFVPDAREHHLYA